jgi:predicted transglutaminase-like cysteine proteinase
MVGLFCPRGVLRVLAIMLAMAGVLVSTAAAAKPKAKRPAEATVSLRSPLLDMRLPDELSVRPAPFRLDAVNVPSGARFFTINQVLAKHDGLKHDRLAPQPRLASAVTGDTVSDAPVMVPSLPPASDEPFGLFVFRAPEGALWVKWRALETALRADAEAIARCRADAEACSAPAARLLSIVEAAQPRAGRSRFSSVNAAVNAAVRYTSDYARHGVADHWSAPLETLAAGQGDCEDYAIAKFVALREAGVAAADLRLLLVRDLMSRQDHAVLAARQDGSWLVMDNRWDALMEPAALARFMPLFALDHDGVKLFAAPYAARPLHESETDIAPAGDDAAVGGGSLMLAL